MSTKFVEPKDLMKIRELRLRQEIAQTQAQSHGYAMQAELGRLYLKLGLSADDSINIDTGFVTIAHPDAGPVPIDPGSRLTPGEAQTTGDPTFTA